MCESCVYLYRRHGLRESGRLRKRRPTQRSIHSGPSDLFLIILTHLRTGSPRLLIIINIFGVTHTRTQLEKQKNKEVIPLLRISSKIQIQDRNTLTSSSGKAKRRYPNNLFVIGSISIHSLTAE